MYPCSCICQLCWAPWFLSPLYFATRHDKRYRRGYFHTIQMRRWLLKWTKDPYSSYPPFQPNLKLASFHLARTHRPIYTAGLLADYSPWYNTWSSGSNYPYSFSCKHLLGKSGPMNGHSGTCLKHTFRALGMELSFSGAGSFCGSLSCKCPHMDFQISIFRKAQSHHLLE